MPFGSDIAAGALAGKPKIPDWNTVSLTDSQKQSISANTSALPDLENLASGTNSFNQDQILQMFQKAIPGYTNITQDSSKNIDSMLKGELPADVQSSIQDSAAARGLSGGMSGSQIGNLTAKDLGLTSLDLTQRGLSSAQNWISMMSQITEPSMFNVSSMFISPQQQFQDTFQNQEAQFQRDYVSNQNDWQHSTGALMGQDLTESANSPMIALGSLEGGNTSGFMKTAGGGGTSSGMNTGFGNGAEETGELSDSFGGGAASGAATGATVDGSGAAANAFAGALA